MTHKMLRRTLWNAGSLVIGVSGIQLFAFLFYMFVEKSSTSGYSDVGVPANMSEGLTTLFIDVVLVALFILYWSMKVGRDIVSFRNHRLYFVLNIFIFLIPYTPLIYWGLKKSYTELISYFDRQAVLSTITRYETISLPEGSVFVAFEESRETLILYTSTPGKIPHNLPDKRLILNPGSPAERQLSVHALDIYALEDTHLHPLPEAKPDTHSNASNVLILKTQRPETDCNVYEGDIENSRLMIVNGCISKPVTISGFRVYNRSNSPFRGDRFTIDSEKKYWFLFYTEPRDEEINALYVGVTDSFNHTVYQIPLKKEDQKTFDSDNILTLYKKGNRLYLISAERILYFPV